jgi:hypothetical protein
MVFTAADVGKNIAISSSAPNSPKLITTITAFVSAKQIELADAASEDVSGGGATWGTDCGPALQAALDRLEADWGGSLHIDGAYLLTTPVSRQFFNATRTELMGFGASDRLYIAVPRNTTAITIQSARSLVIDGVNLVGTPGEPEDAWRSFRFEDCELFVRNCGFFGLASALNWEGSIISTSRCHVSVHDTYFGGCAGSNGRDNPTFDLQGWKSCDFQRTHFIDYGSIGGIEHSKTGLAFSYSWVSVDDPHSQKKGAGHQGVARFVDCLFDEGCLWGIQIRPSTPGLRIRSAFIDGCQMNNTLIAEYSAIYAEAVDRLIISNSAIGWAQQPHDGIRIEDCGDVEIDGVQFGDGVNGLRASKVGRITMRGNSGFGSFNLASVGVSPVVARLDFENGQYNVGGTAFGKLTEIPGFSYARVGRRGEVYPGSGVITFEAGVPAIIPGVGYFSRGALVNRFYSSRDLDLPPWYKAAVSVLPNQIAAPDGLISGDKVLAVAGATATAEFQGVPPNSGFATVSMFAKMAEMQWVSLYCNDHSHAAAWFDLQNGVVGAIQGAAQHKEAFIYDCGTGWFLCVLVCTAAGPGDNAGAAHAQVDGSRALTHMDGTKGFYAWGAGCYNVALAFPPVITTTTSARPTIGADEMAFSLPNGLYNAGYTFDDGSVQSIPVSVFDGSFRLGTHGSALRRPIIRGVVVVAN